MTIPPYRDFSRLLAEGRPDGCAVAYSGSRLVRWRELRNAVTGYRKKDGAPRCRVLLADTTPLDFLARLMAALIDCDVPVIPPNFQPQTIASLAGLPVLDGQSPPSLELYTSGSSGDPKCVRKTLRQLDAECRVHEHCWGDAVAHATIVSTTPHHHIYGMLFRLLWPLCAGRPFDNVAIADPSMLSERLACLKDTVLISSPAQLSRLPELVDLTRLDPRPRLVFSSGGPLALDTARQYAEAWGAPPIEIFGSTETGGIAWRRQTERDARWAPLPGVAVDSDPDGALLVRSPFLPEDSWLRMEDAAEFDGDGRFALRGRLDRILKIEEERLSLPEMETWIAQHGAVTAAALVPVAIGRRTVLGAVVATTEGRRRSRKSLVADLRTHLRQKYDEVLLPRRWRFVEHLPYNERGKLVFDDLMRLVNSPP